MTPTLKAFMQALLTPDLSLTQLTTAQVRCTAEGLPLLERTTRFAEARITWQDEEWLVAMPLTAAAMPRVERIAARLHRLHVPWLAEYRILPSEMHYTELSGEVAQCDLLLQLLPAGKPFAEALLSISATTLRQALDRLEEELRTAGLSHNNLKATNLIWDGERLVPIRYHEMTAYTPEGDAAAFAALRRAVDRAAQPAGCGCVSDVAADYSPFRTLTGHLSTGACFEGLIRVEDATGWGFVDRENRPVIPAQYKWVGDFRENRAEVECFDGRMGLIDREGRYILPPEYEIVDYLPARSIVYARKEGRWARFDYLGVQRSEFCGQLCPELEEV